AGAGGRLSLGLCAGWREAGWASRHPARAFIRSFAIRSARPMSDHFSGPRAIAGPAGDIADVYAFPSPDPPGHLVLAMTRQPPAPAASSFSDAIVYRFRLRPATVAPDRPAFPFGPEDSALVFACSFEPARPPASGAARPVQDGYCVAPSGETARF